MNQKEQFDNALAQLRSGNLQMAAELCDLNLRKYPGDGNFLCLSARANLAMRNFGIAEARVEEAIRRYPDFAMAHETFGDLMLVQGRTKKARSAYETAMRLDPTSTTIHDKLDKTREVEALTGEEAAKARAGKAMRFEAEIRQAREYEDREDHKSAEMIYREILKKDPDHVEAARLLAGIASLNKRYRDAEIFLKKAVSTAPDYTRAWADLTNVQRELDKLDDAVVSARKVVELAPESSESHVLYASAIGMAGDHEGAIESYRKALELSPERPAALCGMAHHQKTIGQQGDAIESYRRAIAAKPDHSEAYWSLANLKTFRFEDHEIAAMVKLLEDENLPEASRAQIHNALGFEFEGRKDYGQAFHHFDACNTHRRQLETYDPVDTETTFGKLIELFDRDFIERNEGAENADVTPILVVGLPRSGSTLIEQILASHSRVDGTHELGDLARSVQAVRRQARTRERFPEALAEFSLGDWRRVGEEYLDRTRIFRSDAPYFDDKNPNNFIYVGLLKLALPNARIIDARRHPLDSCLGSFKQLFASGQPFTYDMTELGEYYLQYHRLMDHWNELLPGHVLEVRYEDVVADLDGQVRRILEYCGLEFEESCLRFHETERAVKTASSEQVRRPIYSSSVNKWRHYEPYLGELIHILEPILRELPAENRPGPHPA